MAVATCDPRCHKHREQPAVAPRSGKSTGLDCGPALLLCDPGQMASFLRASVYTLQTGTLDSVSSKVMSISRGPIFLTCTWQAALISMLPGHRAKTVFRTCRVDIVPINHP